MTPLEANVREAIKQVYCWGHQDDIRMAPKGEGATVDEYTTAILALIEGEVRAERERIAQMMITIDNIYLHPKNREKLADAIRSSGEGK